MPINVEGVEEHAVYSSTKVGVTWSAVKISVLYMTKLMLQENLTSLLTYEQGVKELTSKLSCFEQITSCLAKSLTS